MCRRRSERYLPFQSLLCSLVLLTCAATESRADIIFAGTGDLTINGVFQPSQDFTVEFVADQPAVDTFRSNRRGIFLGTTTLTLADPSLMVTQLESTNVTAIRQDRNPEGLFLISDASRFNAGFSAVFQSSGVIADPNVLVTLSSTPEAANWQGAGLTWQFTDGTTVQFNQASNLTVSGPAAIPEPGAVPILFAGISLLACRRKR